MNRFGIRALGLAGAALLGACTTVGPDFEQPQVPWLADWKGGSLESLVPDQRDRPADRAGMVAQLQRSRAGRPDRRGTTGKSQRAHRRPSHHGSTRPARDRRQHTLSASTASDRRLDQDGAAKGRRTGCSATTVDAGLRISWELDFWGRFRRSIEAADAGYLASIAQYDDLQVLMAAQVASLYCSIRTLEARLRIVTTTRPCSGAAWKLPSGCSRGAESELDVQQARPVSGYAGHLPQLKSTACGRRRTR